MAHVTRPEFDRAIAVLTDHFGLPRLRDRLASLGAFRSRRGLNSPASLGERVFRLSGGLRLDVGATYAFSAAWGEMLSAKLGEDGERMVDELADKVNACLSEGDRVIQGKESDLDAALSDYHHALAAKVGDEVAAIDMLLKSVPEVAARLRTSAGEEPAQITDAPSA